MKRKVNCEKQEKCRVCKMCSWICSWFSQKDKQTSSDNPLDAFVPPENPMEMHIDMETPDFLKEDQTINHLSSSLKNVLLSLKTLTDCLQGNLKVRKLSM